MSATVQPDGLRLRAGHVTVLLGPAAARRAVVERLDGGTARCPHGHGGLACVTAAAHNPVRDRLAALALAGAQRPSVLVVDRLTDGLAAGERRALLAELRTIAAAGPAVLVDDADPVAALAVADGVLRIGPDGSLHAEALLPADGRYRGE
jgi:hypothetical protein